MGFAKSPATPAALQPPRRREHARSNPPTSAWNAPDPQPGKASHVNLLGSDADCALRSRWLAGALARQCNPLFASIRLDGTRPRRPCPAPKQERPLRGLLRHPVVRQINPRIPSRGGSTPSGWASQRRTPFQCHHLAPHPNLPGDTIPRAADSKHQGRSIEAEAPHTHATLQLPK